MLDDKRWLCACGDHYLSGDELSLSFYERRAAKSNEQHGGSARPCNDAVRFCSAAVLCNTRQGVMATWCGAAAQQSAFSAASNMRIYYEIGGYGSCSEWLYYGGLLGA